MGTHKTDGVREEWTVLNAGVHFISQEGRVKLWVYLHPTYRGVSASDVYLSVPQTCWHRQIYHR